MAASSWTLVGLFLSTLLDAAQLQRDCSPPPQYPNAKLLETPPRHKFADGDKVVYSCARDYSATPGRMWLRCNNGEWTKLAGKCEKGPTSCSPPKVSNSAPSETSVFQVGQSAIITCSPGFQLDGAQKITCDRSGQWQPEPPQCRPSRTVEKQQATTDGGCAAPRDVHDPNIHLAERYMTRETFKPNERVQFVCGVGYAPAEGSRFRRCIDGEWTPLLLQCERQLCGSAGEIPYGRFAYTGVQFGDTATAACDEGC
ncbi:complement factor H-related protein 1-like [Neosynchiropus ocellatus]